MQNSTGSETNFVAWAGSEAECSGGFRDGVDRLRRLAAGRTRSGYSRTTGVLTAHTWAELNALLSESVGLAQSERPRAWAKTDLETDDGLRHVRDYLGACRKLARMYLGGDRAAPLVHALVGRKGYRAGLVAGMRAQAPSGPLASTLAAHISGASWGAGATALLKAWYRARPTELQTPGKRASSTVASPVPPLTFIDARNIL